MHENVWSVRDAVRGTDRRENSWNRSDVNMILSWIISKYKSNVTWKERSLREKRNTSPVTGYWHRMSCQASMVTRGSVNSANVSLRHAGRRRKCSHDLPMRTASWQWRGAGKLLSWCVNQWLLRSSPAEPLKREHTKQCEKKAIRKVRHFRGSEAVASADFCQVSAYMSVSWCIYVQWTSFAWTARTIEWKTIVDSMDHDLIHFSGSRVGLPILVGGVINWPSPLILIGSQLLSESLLEPLSLTSLRPPFYSQRAVDWWTSKIR